MDFVSEDGNDDETLSDSQMNTRKYERADRRGVWNDDLDTYPIKIIMYF